MKVITHIRTYKATATIGEVIIKGARWCYTLEDVARPPGIKVYGETCVPEGCYIATVTHSQRFNRPMILLCSEGKDSIIKDGITFTGVRVHKGNSVEDTQGCILVGMNTNHEDRIWNCSVPDKALLDYVQAEGKCYWVITSK